MLWVSPRLLSVCCRIGTVSELCFAYVREFNNQFWPQPFACAVRLPFDLVSSCRQSFLTSFEVNQCPARYDMFYGELCLLVLQQSSCLVSSKLSF